MDYMALVAYFVALTALTAAPGPLVAVLVARSLGKDVKGAMAFAVGLCMGDMLVICAITLGVGSMAESRPEWFALAKYAGIAYLLWLSVRIWKDCSTINAIPLRNGGWVASAGAGIGLCLGNPSTVLIYMLLLPSVAPGGIGNAQDLSVILLVTFAAVGAVFFGAILLARQFSRVISSPASSILLGRATATSLAMTSLWMLAV